ncbi:MAG: N-formylglutamate deformylase [Gammaproteobacteria bacterium]|nr:N-formylglutamate deformylase [Gammaproteobacteria bacterium]MDE0444016.1 N-formylglutamate deformylase [Gammaproteobacteria bacterium]
MTPADLYACERGTTALILSIPHSGLLLPDGMADRLTPASRTLPDTDWRVDELYDFAGDLGATVLKANYSRYVVDLNRPPDGASLYPGRPVTGVCPLELFSGEPIYGDGYAPDAGEIRRRRVTYWQPYHDRLEAELARSRERHGHAILYDCHSIAPIVPRLFDGRLPALNLGTNQGLSCSPAIQEVVVEQLAASGYAHAVNGRFIGGYITRHYGDPVQGRHVLQMEIAQDAYMDGRTPESYNPVKAVALKASPRRLLAALTGLASSDVFDQVH